MRKRNLRPSVKPVFRIYRGHGYCAALMGSGYQCPYAAQIERDGEPVCNQHANVAQLHVVPMAKRKIRDRF